MKEVTEWDNNPREMWVWDDNVHNRKKVFVVNILQDKMTLEHIVKAVVYNPDANRMLIFNYKHCAEIKERRCMTNKELSRWLREKPNRECKYGDDPHTTVCHSFRYCLDEEDDEVEDGWYVREGDEPWHEPLIEVQE